jgi:DNA-binding transcriptional ArsR family regulator
MRRPLAPYLTRRLNISLDERKSAGIFNAVVKQQARVTAVFAALADPTRRQILERLSGQAESRVTALARPFRMSLPAISRHLRVLEHAGLIKRQRHGREHLIRANTVGLQDAKRWIAECAAGWESGFDALDELLNREQRKEKLP